MNVFVRLFGLALFALCLFMTGCLTIDDASSEWRCERSPIRDGRPGSDEGALARIERIKYRTDYGDRISIGVFPGLPDCFDKGEFVGDKSLRESKGWVVFAGLFEAPLFNAFTLFYPTIEAIFLSPFGVRVGNEESAPQKRFYFSDCALFGMCRWKVAQGGGSRTEKIDKDYEENVAIETHDGFQQFVDDEVPHMVLADGKIVWFSYPGFGRLYDAAEKSGQAMVVFGNGQQVRCFYKSENEPDKLGYKDEIRPTAQVTAFWQCKEGERNVVKDLDVLINEFRPDKDSIKGRGLYNNLTDCRWRARRSFSSSVVDEGSLVQLKDELGRMKTRVQEYERNKHLEKRLSELMENAEAEITKCREEPEFKQVVCVQDDCRTALSRYAASEKIDAGEASSVVSKVERLTKMAGDARRKLEQRRKAEALASEVERIEEAKREVLTLISEAEGAEPEQAISKYGSVMTKCQQEYERLQNNVLEASGDELLEKYGKFWRGHLACSETGKRKATERYVLETKKNAENGDSDAQFRMYTIFCNGNEVWAPDAGEAEKWLKRAAANGNADASELLKARRMERISSFCGVKFGERIENVASKVEFRDGAAWNRHGHRKYQMSYMEGEYENPRPFRHFNDGTIYAGMTSKRVYQVMFVFRPLRRSTVALDEAEYHDTLCALRKKYGEIDSESKSFGGDVSHTFVVDELVIKFNWITEGFIENGKLVLLATRKDLERIAEEESQKYYDSRVQRDLDNREKFENGGVDAL